MALCEKCGKDALHDPEPACRACGFPETMRAPNVLMAAVQRDAVAARYDGARADAGQRGCTDPFDRLEGLANRAVPVVNVPLAFAFTFLTSNRGFYAPYVAQVGAGLRAPAAPEHDRRRRMVDVALYGSYGDAINFGCLAPEGRGLDSYGEVHMELDPSTISFRTTVLQDNSFDVFDAHGDAPPPGLLAVWDDRVMLAAAKCGVDLRPDLDDAELRTLILDCEGDRATDRFLELHIYRNYSCDAVSRARIARTATTREDQGILDALWARSVVPLEEP